jgi:hypothetical protein
MGRYQDGFLGTSFEMYLNKDSPHKAEALDFLRFMTSIEGGQLFQDHSGWLSGTRGVHVPPELEIQRSTGDGYAAGTQYIGVGLNSTMAFWQHLSLLMDARGSVDEFAEAMEDGLRKKVTEDLRIEIRTNLEARRATDSEIMAMSSLNRLEGRDDMRELRQRTLASNQTLSEINEYEAAWALERYGFKQP